MGSAKKVTKSHFGPGPSLQPPLPFQKLACGLRAKFLRLVVKAHSSMKFSLFPCHSFVVAPGELLADRINPTFSMRARRGQQRHWHSASVRLPTFNQGFPHRTQHSGETNGSMTVYICDAWSTDHWPFWAVLGQPEPLQPQPRTRSTIWGSDHLLESSMQRSSIAGSTSRKWESHAICTQLCMCVCMYIYIYIYMYGCINMYIYTYTHIHI